MTIYGIDATIHNWTLVTFVRTLQGVVNRLSAGYGSTMAMAMAMALRIHHLTQFVAPVDAAILTVLRAISIDNSSRRETTNEHQDEERKTQRKAHRMGERKSEREKERQRERGKLRKKERKRPHSKLIVSVVVRE